MAKFNTNIEANILRCLKINVAALCVSLGNVPFKSGDIRDPLKQDTEEECIQFRFDAIRRPMSRTGDYVAVVGYELHCWSKRGDLRRDKATDRHILLACAVDGHFQELDLPIYDEVGGNSTTFLGNLQTHQCTWHFRDKRNTVFGSAVDYSLETPTTNQAVVVVSGLFIRGA